MNSNTKIKFKKEYIPILIAILVLIALVLTLVIVIFYKDDKGLIVPDLPEKESLNVGVYDFDSGKYDQNDLKLDDTKKTNVEYKVISDYYKKGIMISNPTLKYIDDEFIVKSGIYANDPFVSSINKKGELNWINKIDSKSYESIKIIDIIKKNKKYHVFAVGTKDGKKDSLIIRLNEKGNEETREIVSEKSNNSMKKVISTDKGFVIMTDGKDNLEIFYITDEYKMIKNPFYLRDSKDNRFKTYTPYILAAVEKDDIVSMIVSYVGASNNTMYLVKYDLNNNKIGINEFQELNRLSSPYTNLIETYNDSFYTSNNGIMYRFSNNGEILKQNDYNSIKLPEIKNCKEDEQGDVVCTDKMWVDSYNTMDNGTIMVHGSTSSESSVFDVYDEKLDLKKRFVHGLNEHESDDAIYISSVYVDNKLYEFYSFGVDTPSILVSIIG